MAMHICQHCAATEAHFSWSIAARDLERYRHDGPDLTTRLLLAGLREAGLQGGSLLDIGAGIGVLHHEMLNDGIDSATHVEAASVYVTAAQAEDKRRGNDARVRYLVGDAVSLADRLPLVDIVTLDRVICCYPDWETLVGTAVVKARRVIGFSIPRARWYVRLLLGWENLVRKMKGDAFRAFVHPPSAVYQALEQAGFHCRYVRNTLVWHVALFGRSSGASPSSAGSA
jgi:magnesium-protoporphyrin O-methyltransferase